MNGESKQQELAEAIGKVIIPMVETGDGISDEPVLAFLEDQAVEVMEALRYAFETGRFKPNSP